MTNEHLLTHPPIPLNSSGYESTGFHRGIVTPMSFITAKSFFAKPGQVPREWWHVDASDKILGRLATRIATLLMGKHKPAYTPHTDTGDFVVVTNAGKIKLTGNKLEVMEHDSYTYYTSGRKVTPVKVILQKHPERVIEHAVRRMLPKSALGRRMLTKLKVYPGAEHPHASQQPKSMTFVAKSKPTAKAKAKS